MKFFFSKPCSLLINPARFFEVIAEEISYLMEGNGTRDPMKRDLPRELAGLCEI